MTLFILLGSNGLPCSISSVMILIHTALSDMPLLNRRNSAVCVFSAVCVPSPPAALVWRNLGLHNISPGSRYGDIGLSSAVTPQFYAYWVKSIGLSTRPCGEGFRLSVLERSVQALVSQSEGVNAGLEFLCGAVSSAGRRVSGQVWGRWWI